MHNTLLNQQRCEPCEGIGKALTPAQIDALLPQLHPAWHVNSEHTALLRSFSFDNFYATMAFVNAVAWVAHTENHHPDLEVGYNYCRVLLTTHALMGLSSNDFISAAKIDALTL